MVEKTEKKEFKVSLSLNAASILKYLSCAAALFGVIYVIFIGIVAEGGSQVAAVVFQGLLYTTFFSGFLYALSCLVSSLSKKE